ncbi:MAG: glycoside-pentoside-hexuronide (GPH):cation symporter [Clostridiales Family XIII bacterium]|nr:glycoside-pentoside-hexuronide (GPH):cation symporter [Clostridiales Family XIII bacterium]
MKAIKHAAKTPEQGGTSASEKISYGLGGIGYQMTLALTNAFLTLYYTDSALISASFVGTMMLVARFLDGASDIAMGFIIEKTRTRFGKARPWVMIGAVPLAISILLLFHVPSGLAPLPKHVYIFLTYVFMSVVCYTVTALAHSAMLPRISLISNDRNIVTVVLALMQGIATAALVGVFAPALEAFGGESSQNAWTIISVFIAAVSLLLLTLCFVKTKEKLSATEDLVEASGDEAAPVSKTSVRAGLSFLLTSRYFYIIVVLYLTLAVTNGTAGIGVYYMRDVLGDANLMGLFSIITVVPMIVMMPLVPKLFSVFGKRKTLLRALSATIVIKIVMLFFPTSLPIQLICAFLGTLTLVPLWVAAPTMICDLVDYGDFKRGVRTEGLTAGASSFGTKIGTGLGSVILGFGLTIGGYDALAAVQPQSVINAVIFIMIGIPAILCAICLLLVGSWNLEKFKPDVDAYMEARRNRLPCED